MKDKIIRTEIVVKENKIGIMRVGLTNFISLTDLARYQNSSDPSFTVKNWLRRVTTIDYIGLWEQINNADFNLVEFDQIKTEYGKNSFAMSPTQWIKRTNAIGIIAKGGRYSIGTYAHPDIAFEFASWLSPEFKLYLITEFERLKSNEAYQEKVDWQANRLLSKLNYVIHTDAIKNYIVPTLTEAQKKYVCGACRLVFEEGAEEVCSIPDQVQIIKIPDSIKENMYCCGGWERIEIECSQKIAKKICGSRMDPFSYDPITLVLHVPGKNEMKVLVREKLDYECKPHYSLKAKGGKFEFTEYDNQLVENTGKFKLKQPEQLLAMVYRLMYPVSLGELHKSVFEEKVIKYKKKLLTTIEGQLDEDEILAFLETINQ